MLATAPCPIPLPMRLTDEELRDKALLALEEIAAAAEKAVVPKTAQLRFLLAFLARDAKERWPFDAFWKAATSPPMDDTYSSTFARQQKLTNAVAGIYVQLGLKRP